ncbi:MAG: hypothetical protein ACHRHE_10675 [Tepidisphaerales bacterium]
MNTRKPAWSKLRVIAEIVRLHRNGHDLSYNRTAAQNQALVSAAAYHFGSFRQAVQESGIDYAGVLRRPRWSAGRIVELIRKARRAGEELNWGAVSRRHDELGHAAFASLQKRLFGTWNKALAAAGVDAGKVALYRRWTKTTLASALQTFHCANRPMSSGDMQKRDPGLHAAALRLFGSYDAALKAARVEPSAVRRRRRWTRDSILAELRSLQKKRPDFSGKLVRARYAALYGAAIRSFGSFKAAERAL